VHGEQGSKYEWFPVLHHVTRLFSLEWCVLHVFTLFHVRSTLAGKHVVFGKVIRGFDDVVGKITQVSVDEKNRPTVPVIISNCGELELRKKQSSAPPRTSTRIRFPWLTLNQPPTTPSLPKRIRLGSCQRFGGRVSPQAQKSPPPIALS